MTAGITNDFDPTGAPANRFAMIQTTTAAITGICAESMSACLLSSARRR
jgi:hypothetical protein